MHGSQAAGASAVLVNVRVRLCARPASASSPYALLSSRDRNNGIRGAPIAPRQVEPPPTPHPPTMRGASGDCSGESAAQAHTQ